MYLLTIGKEWYMIKLHRVKLCQKEVGWLMKPKMQPNKPNNKLKGKLKEKGLTYKDTANLLGISITSFAQKINGQRSFTVPEVKKLSESIGLSDREIYEIFLS